MAEGRYILTDERPSENQFFHNAWLLQRVLSGRRVWHVQSIHGSLPLVPASGIAHGSWSALSQHKSGPKWLRTGGDVGCGADHSTWPRLIYIMFQSLPPAISATMSRQAGNAGPRVDLGGPGDFLCKRRRMRLMIPIVSLSGPTPPQRDPRDDASGRHVDSSLRVSGSSVVCFVKIAGGLCQKPQPKVPEALSLN